MIWHVIYAMNGDLFVESFIGPEAKSQADDFAAEVDAREVWGC